MKRKSIKSRAPAGTSIRFVDTASALEVTRAAKILGVGPSTFVREAAEKRAEEVLREHERSIGMCRECGRPLASHEGAA